ncbi:MAG TPA: winged helix-turn-helix domain-containing protein [Caulobacteraceae bacterium]|jgi:DNA-binding response OmpR family regulator|nr:winged helix-turn-helix domain-containing protein [Caulobacteraceae bacterium]
MASVDGRFAAYGREDLIDRILWLESEVGFSLSSHERARIADKLRLTPKHTRLLLALYRARGRVLSVAQLIDTTDCETESRKAIVIMVCHIRDAHGDDVIRTHPTLGYSITAKGIALVEHCLKPELVAA